ncbi:glycoside hydrolase family 99-like domain-containing protein [Actinomyces minihominis]|uniref:glycoside hydrolase family 99-like domain-containing protein n=1 Tax=Actinomyces minihominis TaxID=2002838 RepID=UPI001F5C6219|nr:glycoside hydrolase family 99-like domain-containing protein [Actinomyces minihominis]
MAVVIHVYYLERLAEIQDRLSSIPVPFDLFVTNSSGQQLDEAKFHVGEARNVAVLEVENRGRDIFPLIQLVNAGFLDAYQLVLKVHTKESAWREGHQDLAGSGEEWKSQFLDQMLGSRDVVEGILASFANDTSIGSVTADGNVLGEKFWGSDETLTKELAMRLEFELEAASLEFSAGSMYWIRGFLLQGLRALQLSAVDFEDEAGQIDGTTAHAIERLLGVLTVQAGLRLTESSQLDDELKDEAWQRWLPDAVQHASARFVPFYLPQFHPSKENDRWWGEGFTEWTNLTNSQPVFRGHEQPLLPGRFGFYDLRLDEVREAQYELSSWAGVEGFMYYYYWFAGKRILNLPIEKLAAQEGLNQPFCIMWANENWTRAWDGRESNVLIGQRYDEVPATDFIDDVMEFLTDPRYLKVDGKPVLAVYRPAQMEDFKDVVAHWRERAEEAGLPGLFLLAVEVAESFGGLKGSPEEWGLDGSMGFPPHALPWKAAPAHRVSLDPRFRGNFVSYKATAEAGAKRARQSSADHYPGVMVSFDNTARRQWRPDIWWGSNPYVFHRWLREAMKAVSDRHPQHRLVFINAWNEWAESAVLEPTQRFGITYLLAVRNVAFS